MAPTKKAPKKGPRSVKQPTPAEIKKAFGLSRLGPPVTITGNLAMLVKPGARPKDSKAPVPDWQEVPRLNRVREFEMLARKRASLSLVAKKVKALVREIDSRIAQSMDLASCKAARIGQEYVVRRYEPGKQRKLDKEKLAQLLLEARVPADVLEEAFVAATTETPKAGYVQIQELGPASDSPSEEEDVDGDE